MTHIKTLYNVVIIFISGAFRVIG